MSKLFPIPLHLMYLRHRLPVDMRPRHMDIIVPLTDDQLVEWKDSEDKRDFASELLLFDAQYFCSNLGKREIELLSDAFDNWYIGGYDWVFDVGVYSLGSAEEVSDDI